MIPSILALVPTLLAPQGPLPSDTVDTYESVLTEYKQVAVEWRRAKRAAKKEDRLDEFTLPNPLPVFYERFDALAQAGEGQAMLWTGLNAGELPLTAGEVARIKRERFEGVVSGFADEPYAKTLADRLDDQEEWLTDQEIAGFLARLYEGSTREKVRAAAGYKLARRLEKNGGEEQLVRAREWYERICATFPTTREASKAASRLRGLKTAVGRIAPDFDAVDVDGNAFKLSDYRGKVTVIDFWGFW